MKRSYLLYPILHLLQHRRASRQDDLCGDGLPAITASVVIDGTLQPGFAGSPLIELNGAGAGT